MSAEQMDRRKYLGSHAFSSIIGKNPWQNKIGLWMYMRGLTEGQEQSEAMTWGLRLQDAILDEHGERNGVVIDQREKFITHSKYPYIGGHADGLWQGKPNGVDAKNVRYFDGEWGEPGTDQVPDHVLCQAHHFNMLFDTDAWYVAALGTGNEYREYRIERDKGIDKMIINLLLEFWEDNIIGGEEPEIDGSNEAAEYLAKKYKTNTDVIREAREDEVEIISKYKALVERMTADSAEEKRLQTIIKSMIGEDQGIAWEGNSLTWKNQNGATRVDTKALKQQYPDIAKEFEKTGNPTRVFRKAWDKE